MIRTAIVVFTAFWLQSCVSIPKCNQLTVDEGASSRIIVYRKAAVLGFAASQNIGFNDCLMGSLWNGSYLVQAVTPGDHEVHVIDDFGRKVSTFPIAVEAKKDYYLKWSFEVDDVYFAGPVAGTTGKHHFQVVDRQFAISELDKLKNIE